MKQAKRNIKSAVEIIESIIEATPIQFQQNKSVLYLSTDLYTKLNNEKKRTVKSYKGFKIITYPNLPNDTGIAQ